MGRHKGRQLTDLEQAERDEEACNLRRTGMSYAQIGRQLGESGNHARLRVQRALDDLARSENKVTLRTLAAARLDELYRIAWHQMHKPNAPAIDIDRAQRTAIRIEARRAAMFGYDAPTAIAIHEISEEEAIAELESREANLRLVSGGPPEPEPDPPATPIRPALATTAKKSAPRARAAAKKPGPTRGR